MFHHLPTILIHKITTYIGYSDVFMSLKYINKEFKFNIFNNIKLKRRQQYIYFKIILQQLYHKNKYSNYNFSHNISFENYCNKLFKCIDLNILSTSQKLLLIKINNCYDNLINQ